MTRRPPPRHRRSPSWLLGSPLRDRWGLRSGRKAALILGIILAASAGVIAVSLLDSTEPRGSAARGTDSPSADPATFSPTPSEAATASTPGASPSGGPGLVTTNRTPTVRNTGTVRATDRRYENCAQVIDAGLGPYKQGRDPEYQWYVDDDRDGWVCERSPDRPATPVHYRNCAEVVAAGAAPLYRGEPGYDRHLDRDGDGVACN